MSVLRPLVQLRSFPTQSTTICSRSLWHSLLPPVTSRSTRPQLACPFSTTTRPRLQYTRFPSSAGAHTPSGQWDRRMRIVVVIGTGGVAYYVTHLEQVPETGRWRFMDISPKYEARLAETAYAELVSEFQGKILPANHPITRHVRRVVTDILQASNLGVLHATKPRRSSALSDEFGWDEPFMQGGPHTTAERGGKEWNLLVVNDPKIVNAMATFGNIVVFTGILPICKDEQGLAAVLGHEIGHVVARHAPERYSSSKVLILFAFLLQSVGLDVGISQLLSKLFLELPNSRVQELEADSIGMHLIAKACYDPHAAIEMHNRLAKHEMAFGGTSLEFLRTHPGSSRRIQHLEELVPEAYSIRAGSPQCAGIRDSVDKFLQVSRSG
ncbi:peptidase family M48-domain-containing protein [Phlebopus sp. FC_14]|nr:peptidase family M48-domain-containing protein [Phlebopus sp. FC_14]